MIQIGTVIISEPNLMDDTYISRQQELINATNQRRLEFMRKNGVDINNVPDEKTWREFYENFLKLKRYGMGL
jgi:TRAP-type C4-dicarboxylate transport system substrate-binding protein